MAQTDQIHIQLSQPVGRGVKLDVPYPEGRNARDYRQGGALLHVPGMARHLIESGTTFMLQYGSDSIGLVFLSDMPLPGGTRCELRPRILEQTSAMMLPEGEIVSSFGAALQAVVPVITYDTPYKAGDFAGLSPLSPLSVARIIDTDGRGGGRAFGVDPALLAAAIGVRREDGHEITPHPSTQALAGTAMALSATGTAVAARTRILPGQETRNLAEYDSSRIKAEIDELGNRFRDHGHDAKPKEANSGLPLQVIRNASGEILMQGRAASVEHLIAIKLDEAEKTNDPNKKIVSLAGAQLDERTMGRKLEFSGFEFKNVDMRGANLGGAKFHDCKLENIDAEGVNLKGATFNMCHMKNVNLNGFTGDSKTKFENTGMENVHMAGANAPEVKFLNIRAEGLNLEGANLAGSSWTHVHVDNLYAKNTNMNGAKIGDFHVRGRESNMDGIKLNGATVHNASFGTPEYGIPMRGMEAQNSTWTDVQFNKSDLSGADFTKAAFTRVDMRKVVTPQGPMQMREADLTGLNAGPDAHLMAFKATYGGVTMFPQEEFVFKGTAPIERAFQAATSLRSDVANIISADGATTQELEASNVLKVKQQQQQALLLQQRQMALKRQQMEMAPSPYNKNKKKDTPW